MESKKLDAVLKKVNPALLPSNLNSSLGNKPRASTSHSRLPSFRGQRDFSLSSGTKRKSYTPNIPIRREQKEKLLEIKTEKPSHKRNERPSKGRGRGRGKEREFIQTQGTLFGEGVAAAPLRRGSAANHFGSGGGGKASDVFLQKPVLNPDAAFNIDNDLEKKRLKELLRDDFIDDPDEDAPDLLPIQLPMDSTGRVFKEDSSDLSKQNRFKGEIATGDAEASPSRVKVKTEPLDDSDICASMNNIKVKPDPKDTDRTPLTPQEMSVSQILTGKHDLLFVKLPNCLPSHPPEVKEEVTGGSLPGTSLMPSSSLAAKGDQTKELCTLETLPEGQIGTIRIYKSGKTEFLLGDHKLLIDKGTQQGFLQDAVKITTDAEKRQGDLTILGHIQHRLVCMPDFEAISKYENS